MNKLIFGSVFVLFLLFMSACNVTKLRTEVYNVSGSEDVGDFTLTPPKNFFFDSWIDSIRYYNNDKLVAETGYIVKNWRDKDPDFEFKEGGEQYLAYCSSGELKSKLYKPFKKPYKLCFVYSIDSSIVFNYRKVDKKPLICNAFIDKKKYNCKERPKYIEELLDVDMGEEQNKLFAEFYNREVTSPLLIGQKQQEIHNKYVDMQVWWRAGFDPEIKAYGYAGYGVTFELLKKYFKNPSPNLAQSLHVLNNTLFLHEADKIGRYVVAKKYRNYYKVNIYPRISLNKPNDFPYPNQETTKSGVLLNTLMEMDK